MEFSFTQALLTLDQRGGAFRVINEARPASSYVFAQILPERSMTTYEVQDASMTVRSAMAGLVGMDAVYPSTGAIEMATFLEKAAKLANRVTMSERALRELQNMVQRLQLAGSSTNERMLEEVLNFTNAVLVQPHLDTAEWLRGQALGDSLDWKFGDIRLKVSYGIPSGNKLTARTGNDAYGGSTSKFWDDVRAANRLLRGGGDVIHIAHPDMVDDIVYNSANAIRVLSMDDSSVTIQRMISQNGTNTPSTDARDTVRIVKYGLEAEVIDPTAPTTTKKIPFMPRTKVYHIGQQVNTQYVVGAGSRQPEPYELGYTHLAPTVESGGAPGRWSRVYTPEGRPWQLEGEAVANLLPVINAHSVGRIVIASSTLSS